VPHARMTAALHINDPVLNCCAVICTHHHRQMQCELPSTARYGFEHTPCQAPCSTPAAGRRARSSGPLTCPLLSWCPSRSRLWQSARCRACCLQEPLSMLWCRNGPPQPSCIATKSSTRHSMCTPHWCAIMPCSAVIFSLATCPSSHLHRCLAAQLRGTCAAGDRPR